MIDTTTVPSRTVRLLKGNILELKFPYDRNLLEKIRQVEGRKWDDKARVWKLNASFQAIEFVLEHKFTMTSTEETMLLRVFEDLERVEDNKSERLKLAMAETAPSISDVESQMLLKPYPYQWVPCHYFRSCSGSFLLADDPGIGKSVQSLMVTHLPELVDKTVLIVTPVPYTFQAEIRKFFGKPSMVLEGEIHYLNPRIRFYLVTYHRLKWLFENREKRIPKEIYKDLVIIGDEAHNFKNRAAIRTKFMRALGKYSRYKIALTGTPVLNRPSELYEIISWLIPNFMSWTEFTRKYCNAVMTQFGRDTSGHSNLSYLREWLFNNLMIRREKKQVLKHLPAKVRSSVEFLKTPIKVSAESMFELYANSARVKAAHPAFREWVSDLIQETDKVVFVGFHQDILNAVDEICRELKVKNIRIDGQNSDQHHRFALIKEFETNPKCRVANISIACGGTGLNGLQVAQVMGFCDRLHRD